MEYKDFVEQVKYQILLLQGKLVEHLNQIDAEARDREEQLVKQMMEKAGIAIERIHDMFVTHAHTDHILGAVWVIRMVAQQMQSGKYAGGFRVYGHDKVLQVLDWICRMTLPKKIVQYLGNGIELCEVKDGETFKAV